MTKTVSVSSYTRRSPEKSPAYIDTHLALMSPEDAIRFAQMHGMQIANDAPRRQSIIDRFMPWFGRRK